MAPELIKEVFGCEGNEKVFPPLKVLRKSIIKSGSRLYRVLFRPFAKMVRTTFVPTQPYFTTVIGINSFVEPNFLFYEVHYPPVDRALADFRAKLPFSAEAGLLFRHCSERRRSRIQLCEEQVTETAG